MHEADTVAQLSAALARFVSLPPRASAALQTITARRLHHAARDVLRQPSTLANAVRAAIDATSMPHCLIEALAIGCALAERTDLAADAPTLAAAIATADFTKADEERTIAAIAVGREIAARLHSAVISPEFTAAWDVRAVIGRFGAAAAAAHLIGLDALQTRHAIGLAATQASGLRAAADSAAGLLACGKAASDALEGALLARHQFSAAAASLEGRRGFGALMAAHFDAVAVLEGLGERWIS